MKTNKHLIISGVLFTVVLFLWPIFMAISQPQGDFEEQFNWIQNNLTIYKVQFFFAFLLSPSILYLMFAQLEKLPPIDKVAYKIGSAFISGYFVLNSVAYASQLIVLPNLIKDGFTGQVFEWYFGSSTSVSYFLNQMGYCFWGVGAIILFFRFSKDKGIVKYLSIIYTVSGVLSIIAFLGLIIDNTQINSITLYSGLVLIPIGIMSIVWGLKENKTDHPKIFHIPDEVKE